MSIFSRFREPPPPPPIYKRQPVASAAIILTLIGMFVLGPVGYLWNGMAEELKTVKMKVDAVQKEKATNEDVKAALEELKAQRREQAVADKEQNDKLQTNQLAIKEILTRQEMITAPKGFKLGTKPKSVEPVDGVTERPEKRKIVTLKVTKKPVLSPEEFAKYMEMKPEHQEKYKKYLESRGYDINGL